MPRRRTSKEKKDPIGALWTLFGVQLKGWFDDLDPKIKKWAAIIAAVVVLVLGAVAKSDSGEAVRVAHKANSTAHEADKTADRARRKAEENRKLLREIGNLGGQFNKALSENTRSTLLEICTEDRRTQRTPFCKAFLASTG